MARIYRDEDSDLAPLHDRRLAIIGYGNQGQAQALNLRDSGLRVIVGSPSDSSAEQARQDGFEVYPIARAVAQADVIFLLVPDEVMPQVYAEHIALGLRAGMALNFASGYNITFKHVVPPANVDVVMVAPRMIGKGVRDTYVRGLGFPSLIAVEQDATGHAQAVTLAIAKGIGSTRMGVVQSSFQEETTVDLFSEQSGDLYLPRLMFTALVEAGCDPDVVLLELYASGELSEMYAAARDMGLWGQLRLHSHTSQYGQQVTARKFLDQDAVLNQLRAVIAHIRSGEFAQEWKAEQDTGSRTLLAVTNDNLKHPMQAAENRLYRMLGRRNKDLDQADWLDYQAPTP